jgi:hypothetical protein
VVDHAAPFAFTHTPLGDAWTPVRPRLFSSRPPVPDETPVVVLFRDGAISRRGEPARVWNWRWHPRDPGLEIIAYQIVRA